MTKSLRTCFAMTLSIFAFALTPSAATAQVYTGSWPFVVTQQEGPFSSETTTYCITLTDYGSGFGRSHYGAATVAAGPLTGPKEFGYFEVLGQFIIVNIEVGGGNGEVGGWVFVATTSNTTTIGTGIFDLVGGGDIGFLTVGKKHGCDPGA
jgi:hypothetical protein